MKAILVLEMPSSCRECNMSVLGREKHTGQMCFECVHHPTIMVSTKETKRPDWCPLKSSPQKQDICGKYNGEYYSQGGKPASYKIGYNACIDEILGDKE